ncbi:zinc finger CCCH domain-containing protein 13 [Lucilia sericata]|uniref:zinc finger CCCH domain-containing protein 13 n=1 Tax=Lucilia sericata TaxID=13632 RepID=UPI0018A840AD|nr:zinc finger CCCH domain-containing protein 13 [Lucilia sericata]
MALRLRRDVQKASYYVWFLGAEEAKGLRGHRVINSVLPYLIDRSRTQEPIKVTLQVSHKGIKIIQGSSKHFIPHSAITSSVQTDDIVACVLLLYNPVTKCPLHVHAYRCDSETTAEALNQQLQILINRPENQKRFEDLESRLGIIPGMPSLSSSSNKTSNHNDELNHKKESQHNYDDHHHKQQARSARHEPSSKRFVSSLGSDTGNSTRDSECSEDISGNSPISRSPLGVKPLPLQQQPLPNPELFDSLAAELRAKLNGNGPPLLLPPRDYDTVHRSKGNLTAIELRRCRNQLIVGSNRPGSKTELPQNLPTSSGKQVSSRGSSGIGSDLAPSPERQDINTSSDDEHWSNEADNSVIALKPSQISLERTAPINQHHMNLTRKNAVHPRDDSYLRDLPAKPYTPRDKLPSTERDPRSKTPSSSSWTREDEIKPIIVRPSNYDSKINRVLQSEQYAYNHHKLEEKSRERSKIPDVEKSNEMAALMKKNLSLNHDVNDQRYKYKSNNSLDDFDDQHHHAAPHHGYRKENLTDKQKFMEYSTSKTKPSAHPKSYAADEVQRYGGKHRYVDPADLPFEQNVVREKYAGYHRESNSPDQSELGHRTAERSGARSRDAREVRDVRDERNVEAVKHHSRDREREHHSRSKERNPYREPESIPYIESMEKMMKSSAMRYKSYDSNGDLNVARTKEPLHSKLSQRSKAHSQHDEERDYSYNYPAHGRPEQYNTNTSNKERFIETKEKFRAMERSGSRYDLSDEKDVVDYKSRSRGPIETPEPKARAYDDWSDEEHLYDDPPPEIRSRSRSRDQWAEHGVRSNAAPSKMEVHSRNTRPRDSSGKRAESRNRIDSNDYRDAPRYREQTSHDHHGRPEDHRIRDRDQSREYTRRDYSPDRRSGSERAHHRGDRSMERHRIPDDSYPPTSLSKASPSSSGSGIGAPVPHGKAISNMPKGYRHSYAEPVFSRSAGRVGLAAVNPY